MEKQWGKKKTTLSKKQTRKDTRFRAQTRREISPALKNIANCKCLLPKIGKEEKDI